MKDAIYPQDGFPEARLRWAVALLLVIITTGVMGYMLIESWPLLDALYMTITTLTTVGYREVHPLSTAGQIFTMALIVIGVGGMLYTLTAIVTYGVEVRLPGLVRRRRMRERIARLSNHYIICGFGRVGEAVAETLARDHAPYVVIDESPEAVAHCEAIGCAYVIGDARLDETLKAAGIERAKGLVAALDTDEENLYVTLSARVLNPGLFIVARATSRDAEAKLRRVGANRVLTPYELAGRRMATLLLRPLVADFLDTVTHSEKLELLLEELTVSEDSPMVDRTIGELAVRSRTGAIILAIQRKDGSMVRAPDGDTLLHAGDKLVALGTRAQLRSLEKLQ